MQLDPCIEGSLYVANFVADNYHIYLSGSSGLFLWIPSMQPMFDSTEGILVLYCFIRWVFGGTCTFMLFHNNKTLITREPTIELLFCEKLINLLIKILYCRIPVLNYTYVTAN